MLQYKTRYNGVDYGFCVTPDCCEKAKIVWSIVIALKGDGPTATPYWAGHSSSDNLMRLYHETKDAKYGDIEFWREVKFCSFCGTALPEIVSRELTETNINSNEDDYCGTCNERNRNCECWMPETRWKPITEV